MSTKGAWAALAVLGLAGCGGADDDNVAGDAVAKIEQGQRNDALLEAPLPHDAAPTAPTAQAPPAEPEISQDQQDAAQVVRTYFSLLAEGDFAAARNLWEDEGEASDMTPAEFAASFDRYASYRGEVGTPGRVDAGAGQRYIEIPVVVTGALKQGDRPFRLEGNLILHRSAPIEGTTPLDRSWRIRDSTIRPRPDREVADRTTRLPSRVRALYRCEDGSRYNANFNNDDATVELITGRRRLAILDQQPSGSGIAYSADGYELRGKGADAALTFPDGSKKQCTADTG